MQIGLWVVVSALSLMAADVPTIASKDAKDYIGKDAMVCGKVVNTRYLDRSDRQPTFLNFDKEYPNHTFTVVIWGADRAKFGKPEETYLNKDVCASGHVENYQGKPEIIATDPAQLKLQSN